MKFRHVLFALLLPPIFLLTRGRIIGGIFSFVFWILAWILLVTLIFAPFSIIAYIIAFLPASIALRRLSVEDAAEIMAQKMAASMQRSAAQ